MNAKLTPASSRQYECEEFLTAEHYMMVQKTRAFGDTSIARHILDAATPEDAKALGREVRGFNEKVWAAIRYDVVVAANFEKFRQHTDLGAYLRSTEGQILVEANPADRIWGIGLAANDIRAPKPAEWRGLNLLGFALMDVRDRLFGAL